MDVPAKCHAQDGFEILKQAGQINLSGAGGFGAKAPSDAPQDRLPRRRIPRVLKETKKFLIAAHRVFLERQFEIALNGRQQAAEVVRDTARELPDGLHPLDVRELLIATGKLILSRQQPGDVASTPR